MKSLEVQYLGNLLKHPITAGAGPYGYDIGRVLALEDSGIAALTLPSLFAEQIEHAHAVKSHPELLSPEDQFPFTPDEFLQHVEQICVRTRIPIFGSLNGLYEGEWVSYARYLEQMGVAAIELNLYQLPGVGQGLASDQVEERSLELVRAVRRQISIPMAVKLSPHITGMRAFAQALQEAGAQAVVLFNHFFQPDLDIDNIRFVPRIAPSRREDLYIRLSWTEALYSRSSLKICLSGGVHQVEDVVKAVMSGANVVQVVSAILQKGPEYVNRLVEGLQLWLHTHEYDSLNQLRGVLSHIHSNNVGQDTRRAYFKVIQSALKS